MIRFAATLALFLPLAGLLPALSAQADDLRLIAARAHHDSFQKELLDDQQNIERDIKDSNQLLAKMQSDNLDPEMPGFNSACDCRPQTSSGCTADFWASMMHTTPSDLKALDEDTSHGCLKIYEKFGSQPSSSVPGSCWALVVGTPGNPSQPGCGLVRRRIEATKLQKRISALQNKLEQDIPRRRSQIEADWTDAQNHYGKKAGAESPEQPTTLSEKVLPQEPANPSTEAAESAATPGNAAGARIND